MTPEHRDVVLAVVLAVAVAAIVVIADVLMSLH